MRGASKRRVFFTAGSAFFFSLSVAKALENSPVLHLDASGGQIFFSDYQGNNASDTGMGDWLLGDGVTFSSTDLIVSSLNGDYLHQAQVSQIGGGGQILTQTMDNTASLRWLHKLGAWTLKPHVSFKNELATISNQENLGNGIFDFNQGSAGLEAEWKGERLKSVRQDFTASQTNYYNYNPHSSPLFGAELLRSNQALNFMSYSYTLSADYAVWESALLSATAMGSYLDYANQNVAESAAPGTFNFGGVRHDWLGDWTLGLTQKLPKMSVPITGNVGLNAGFVVLDSNQNNLDLGQSISGQSFFTPNFYSYDEISLGPTLNMVVAGKCKISLSYNYAHRNYRDRPAQAASGSYLPNTIWTDTHTIGYSISYPIAGNLNIQTSGGYVYATSNTGFNNFYLYNYSYPYYFAGFGYSL